MNKRNRRGILFVFIFFFIIGIVNQGIGQTYKVEPKYVKKTYEMSLAKLFIPGNIRYRGGVKTLIDNDHSPRYWVDVWMYVNGKLLDSSIVKNLVLKVNNVRIPIFSKARFRGYIELGGITEVNTNLILSHKTLSKGGKKIYKTILRGNGSMKPVTLLTPRVGYVHFTNRSPISRGLLISWTPTSNRIDISIKTYPAGKIIWDSYSAVANLRTRNSIIISNSRLKPGEKYSIKFQQQGHNLKLDGSFKSNSRIMQRTQIWRLFEVKVK